MHTHPLNLHNPYPDHPRHILMLSPVTALALGIIAIGVVALLAWQGGDVGVFKPLSSLGWEGAWGLITIGGILMVASTALMIKKAYALSLVRQMACEVEKHEHWDGIFDYLVTQGFLDTGLREKPKGTFCLWSDPRNPNTHFICVLQETERTIEVHYGTSDDAEMRIMERVNILSDSGFQFAPRPPVYHGLNLATITKTWSSDPTDQDMEHFDHCKDEIIEKFLSFFEEAEEKLANNQHVLEYKGYKFTLQAKGEQRSLHVQKPTL